MVGLVMGLSTRRVTSRWRDWWGFAAWLSAGMALLYGLRGAFGWLLLVVVWYALRAFPNRTQLIRSLMAALAIGLALVLDAGAETLFTVLSTLELDMTPLTPLILVVVGVILYGLFWRGQGHPHRLTLWNLLPAIFLAFTLSIYDVVQKSLPALILMMCGAAYVVYHLHRPNATLSEKQYGEGLRHRFQVVRRGWLLPLAILVMSAFALQHDLRQTAAIFGPSLGLWGPILTPILVLISVLLALSAIALLFILLYPLLPFQAGYLKALVLGGYLLALFVLGVGSDDRLITVLDTLVVGRLIYYLSVPMLIGLYLDIDAVRLAGGGEREKTGEPGETITLAEAATLYLKRLQGIVGTAGVILSLAVPSLYAILSDQLLVTSYFDLLEQLIRLSVGGLS
jgi:hypothetical protein